MPEERSTKLPSRIDRKTGEHDEEPKTKSSKVFKKETGKTKSSPKNFKARKKNNYATL